MKNFFLGILILMSFGLAHSQSQSDRDWVEFTEVDRQNLHRDLNERISTIYVCFKTFSEDSMNNKVFQSSRPNRYWKTVDSLIDKGYINRHQEIENKISASAEYSYSYEIDVYSFTDKVTTDFEIFIAQDYALFCSKSAKVKAEIIDGYETTANHMRPAEVRLKYNLKVEEEDIVIDDLLNSNALYVLPKNLSKEYRLKELEIPIFTRNSIESSSFYKTNQGYIHASEFN